MTDYELLSIMLLILNMVVILLIEYIKQQKK